MSTAIAKHSHRRPRCRFPDVALRDGGSLGPRTGGAGAANRGSWCSVLSRRGMARLPTARVRPGIDRTASRRAKGGVRRAVLIPGEGDVSSRGKPGFGARVMQHERRTTKHLERWMRDGRGGR